MQIRTSFALASYLVTALAVGLCTFNLASRSTPTANVQPSGQTDISHRGSGRIESIQSQSINNLG